jgi:surfeit locus 1 family protein
VRNHRPGYEVVTPLRLDGEHVLVMRGWIEAGRTREALPAVRTPPGEVHVEGIALERLPRVLPMEKAASATVRQSLDIGEFAAQTGLKLRPFFLEQHSPADDGLLRDWPRADAGAEKHQSYSLQWYSFAALSVVLLIVLSFRRVA